MDENTNTPAPDQKSSMMPMMGAVVVGVLLLGGLAFFLMKGNSITNQPVQQPTQAMQPTNTEIIPSPTSAAMEKEPTSTTGAAMEKGSVKTFTVVGKPFSFTPAEIKVKKGDTVKIIFKNEGGTHDWVIDEFNARTKQIAAGETETIEFVANKIGEFEYYCSVGTHRQMGMKGMLIVE